MIELSQGRFAQIRSQIRGGLARATQADNRLARCDGEYIEVSRLDETLAAEIAEMKEKNALVVKVQQEAVEALNAEIEKWRRPPNAAQFWAVQGERTAHLDELVRAQSMKLSERRNAVLCEERQIAERWEDMEQRRVELEAWTKMELAALALQKNGQTAEFASQRTAQESEQESEKSELMMVQEEARTKLEERLAMERTLQERRAELAETEATSETPTDSEVEGMNVDSESTKILETVRRQLDDDFKRCAAQSRARIETARLALDKEEAEHLHEIAVMHDSALKEERRIFGDLPPECANLQQECESLKAELASAEGLEAAMELETDIENLKQQHFQLRNAVEIQRQALNAEFRLTFDQENAPVAVVEFAIEKPKTENGICEVSHLLDQLTVLRKAHDEIMAMVAAERTAIQADAIQKSLCEKEEADGEKRIAKAREAAQAECADLQRAIGVVEMDIEREKRHLQGLAMALPSPAVLVAEREERLYQVAEEVRRISVELEQRKRELTVGFEAQKAALQAAVLTAREQKRTAGPKMLEELNMRLSEQNLALRDALGQHREVIAALRDQKRAVLEFWSEKTEVAVTSLNARKAALLQQMSVDTSDAQIAELESIAELLRETCGGLIVAATALRRRLVSQESFFNRRFGKTPDIGIPRACVS
jgi:hypothetical protein